MNLNKEIQDQKQENITYEQFIAGALLKFEYIDNIDFSLLVEYFEIKTKIDIKGDCYCVGNIGEYIEIKTDGVILLKDGVSLDYFIEQEKCNLREKFLNIAGNIVNNYFNSINVKSYYYEKVKKLQENKKKVLNTANVLLISDIQEEYDEVKKYGFKNVDYFKSIITADSYFAKNPKEIEKYHIILKGNQNVQQCFFGKYIELYRKNGNLEERTHIFETNLSKYNRSGFTEYYTYLIDEKNGREWNSIEPTYTDILDRIVENTLINHTMEKERLKNNKFEPIQDSINQNILPLPIKKSDLKILYLYPIIISEYASEIVKKLGLNITLKEDNNHILSRYVKRNLGEYDIIIVSSIYSSCLLNMNHQSTEQCKDTGRELTLFVSQKKLYYGVDIDIADRVYLNYVFGGTLAPDSEYHSKDIRILRQPIEVEIKNEFLKKVIQSQYSQMKRTIEASVNFYNQALIQMGKPAISDLDFKTEEDDLEYIKDYGDTSTRKEAELAPINVEVLDKKRELDNQKKIVLKKNKKIIQ